MNKNSKHSSITKLGEKEIGEIIHLSQVVGWDYDYKELKTLFASASVYGHKSVHGETISCAAIIPYENNLASIGMVIVHPAYRGKGLAKEVVQHCLKEASPETTLLLIATEEGKPLYQKLGFTVCSQIAKLTASILKMDEVDYSFYHLDNLEDKDIEAIIRLDKEGFGASRQRFLLNRINQAKEAVVLKNNKKEICGYALGIEKTSNLVIGPILAPNDEAAFQLVKAIAAKWQGELRIDVPKEKEKWLQILQKSGFNLDNQPPVMIKNRTDLPDRNGTLYAIAAQSYG